MTSSPVKLIETRRFADERGWFAETYSVAQAAALGIDAVFVQDNHSYSVATGTLRGIHFQRPPHAQGKLVRCARGRIMDYAIDLRRGSSSYGRHVAAELTAAGGEQLWIPVGFGHAFVTLEPECEVLYKVTDLYARDAEGGIRWDSPGLGIAWPLPAEGPTLSGKDLELPDFADFDSPFAYDGLPLEPLQP